jgi:hypothetical protein
VSEIGEYLKGLFSFAVKSSRVMSQPCRDGVTVFIPQDFTAFSRHESFRRLFFIRTKYYFFISSSCISCKGETVEK